MKGFSSQLLERSSWRLSYHSLYNFGNDMECGSSSIWLPALQAKDRVVFILWTCQLSQFLALRVLSHYLFCCVIVSMLNNMEDSLFPFLFTCGKHSWLPTPTAITAPSPLSLLEKLWFCSLSFTSTVTCPGSPCWRGRASWWLVPSSLQSHSPGLWPKSHWWSLRTSSERWEKHFFLFFLSFFKGDYSGGLDLTR